MTGKVMGQTAPILSKHMVGGGSSVWAFEERHDFWSANLSNAHKDAWRLAEAETQKQRWDKEK